MKRIFALLLALAMLLTAAAFAEDKAPDAEKAGEESKAEKILLATVDGEKIYDTDCKTFINSQLSQYAAQGVDTSDPMILAYIKENALSYVIQVKLLLKKAEELGLSPLPKDEEKKITDEAKEQWESVIESFEANYGITSESTKEEKAAARVLVLPMLESTYNYTEESWIQEAITSAIISKVENKLVEDAKVEDKEITEAYDQIVAQYKEIFDVEPTLYEQYTQLLGQPSVYVPEGYRGIAHILLPVDEELMNKYMEAAAVAEEEKEEHELISLAVDESADASDTKEAAKETEEAKSGSVSSDAAAALEAAKQAILDSVKDKVAEIQAEIKKGTAFEKLVEKYGADEGMKIEPFKTEGYPVHKDSAIYDPAFTKAAFELKKVGDVSEPIISTFGVHILKYLNDVKAGPVKMTEEVKETIKQNLLNNKKQELFTGKMNEWFSAAKIEYTDEGKEYLAYSEMMANMTSDSLEAALEDQELEAEAAAMIDEALMEDALYGNPEADKKADEDIPDKDTKADTDKSSKDARAS